MFSWTLGSALKVTEEINMHKGMETLLPTSKSTIVVNSFLYQYLDGTIICLFTPRKKEMIVGYNLLSKLILCMALLHSKYQHFFVSPIFLNALWD